MPADKLLQDAALVVDVCMSVEEDDVVTIICDDEHREQAEAVAQVCVERGAWPVVMNNETQVRRGRADVRFPMAPPRNLHQAMVASDEVIIITNLEWANRFAHVSAVKETCAANGKIASVEGGMGSTWDLTVEDIHVATQRARDAMALLEGKKRVRVTTERGTDFEVSIEGRAVARGDADQAARPDDGPGAAVGRGRLRRRRGLHARHRGRRRRDARHRPARPGQGADHLDRWRAARSSASRAARRRTKLRAAIDGVENATVLGEFAFGTSAKAPYGTPSEKGRVGTVHLALGDNHNAYPGGQNVCSLHLDGVFLKATMQIVDDGTYIIKDGEWAI